jgi:hypothetical protein
LLILLTFPPREVFSLRNVVVANWKLIMLEGSRALVAPSDLL